jgi:hypothetical protein
LPCVGVMIGNSTGACPSIASVALRSVVIVLSLQRYRLSLQFQKSLFAAEQYAI